AWRSAAKEPDHGHGGLLRVRGARPGERRAAQRQYEFPPSNIDCHLTGPQWGRVDWNKKTIARLIVASGAAAARCEPDRRHQSRDPTNILRRPRDDRNQSRSRQVEPNGLGTRT